ncbi:hypothetical protein QA942_21940 [Streptomyces sp. B21-106]|uniref:hypothetical protein n=1 Tax=unclassified Streptomyces TaxID=2593676 RepID=UPI002FF141E1
MSVRTCPWLLETGENCSAPAKNNMHKLGLCEFHSSVQYMTQLAVQGRLLNELGITDHSSGFTFLALDSDGNYRVGHAGTWELLMPKLRKVFRDGELTKVVALFDGGKSQYLSLVATLSPFWIEGRNSTYAPDEELTKAVSELPSSDRFSDLPRNMTGLPDLFVWE